MHLTLTNFFGLLGGLLVLAFVANRFSHRTRVPDVMVLLGCGIVLGPVLHWIDAARFPQAIRGVGTLALILILFAAGMELDLKRSRREFLAGMVLAILSYGLTFAGVSLYCMHALGMHRMVAMVIAAALACVSGSIMIPILDQLNLRLGLKTTLVIEASFGDGLGALGVGVLLSLIGGVSSSTSGGAIFGGMIRLFVWRFFLGFVIAVVAGFLWARLLPYVSNKQFWQALTFAAVLIVYSATGAAGGSELFAVMVFGATLASLLGPQSFLRDFGFEMLPSDQSTQMHSFHSELAFLVRSFFFVLLGAMIAFKGLKAQVVPSLAILGVFVVARLIAVQGSRVVWRHTSFREQELATILIPRGLITAVLALEATEAMPKDLAFLPSLTFTLILFTNVLVLIGSIRAKPLAIKSENQQSEIEHGIGVGQHN
ncbi:MAG TPA: cation:proton antiporter [Acidobacteriaceae bacterium]|nr:cation:proton antiporter [Acidobacteriaceae bacterium]